MDANQLAEALARAIEASKPVQEYCWGTFGWIQCMSRAEWASWVQAVFSIVAIVAAFAVAWTSHFLQRRAELSHQLQLADQVALRVAGRLDVFLNAQKTTLPLFELFFDAQHSIEARKFMCSHLEREIASEQDFIALIVSGRGISHHLLQAITLNEQTVRNTELLGDMDIPNEQRGDIVRRYKETTEAAYASFSAARRGIREYLVSRRFAEVPLR